MRTETTIKLLASVSVATFLAGAASSGGGGVIVLGVVIAVWLLLLRRFLGRVRGL